MDINRLNNLLDNQLKIKYLETVDSTNNYLKVHDFDLVIAANQSAGRGRYANTYYCYEGGLYFSLKLVIADHLKERITIIMALALYDILHHYMINVKIKWLNDLLLNNKKVIGILCDNVYLGSKYQSSIIGVGINLYADDKQLYHYIFNKKIDEELFLAQIIKRFYQLLFSNDYLDRYQEITKLIGKTIIIKEERYLIINLDDGKLIVEDKQGNQKTIDYSYQNTKVIDNDKD